MLGKIGAAMAGTVIAFARALPVIIRDLTGLAAVGSISYGAWLIAPPAGYITGGALVLVGVVLASVNDRKAS